MSMLVGLYIKKALSGHEPLAEMTEGRISPVVFPEVEDIPAPYVTFARTSYSEENTKDGQYGETCGVDITCVGRSYEELLVLNQMVCDALHEDMRKRGGDYEDMPFEVTDMTITAGGEDYDPTTCEYLTNIHVEIETEAHEAKPDPRESVFAMGFPFTVFAGDKEERNDLSVELAASMGG